MGKYGGLSLQDARKMWALAAQRAVGVLLTVWVCIRSSHNQDEVWALREANCASGGSELAADRIRECSPINCDALGLVCIHRFNEL